MAKLVNCKACEKEIAKGAKKCPNCGKDQRNWFMRHKILTTIGAIILISIISSMGGGEESTETATTTTTTEETKSEETKTEAPKETIYKINDVLKVDDKAEVTVTKVEELASVGDEYLNKKASDGGTFVAVQYTIKNVSKEPIGAFSLPTIALMDEAKTEYDSDLDATSNYAIQTDIDNSKILSDLNPNIKVTDVQVFEISKESYATGKWFITIGDQKIQIK
jgi:hypothetical protein